ncbi:hypothetical protein ACFU6R_01335 [Streptomyces sp. NPDC057499]|uniref:hypothetical protein n=1 Tax=Streptomyces sp. NPDC057499 TaxID=3346150 RepID=UPI0036C2B985
MAVLFQGGHMSYGYSQPPGKSRTGLIVSLSVVGGVVVLLAVGVLIAVLSSRGSSSGGLRPEEARATPAGEGSATPVEPPSLGGADARGDVRITGCRVDSLTEWPDADVEIVNGSDGRASYIVSVEFLDGDGTRRASGLATATDLAAGRKSVQKAQGLGEVKGRMTCRVAEVTRLPSQ